MNETTTRTVTSRAEKWELVERWCENYPHDWRLLFKRVTNKTETLEVQVPEDVWRAFDRPANQSAQAA